MATSTAAPTSKLTLQVNIPELIAFKYPTGKLVDSRFGEAQVLFSLVDGRSAYFSQGVAQKIYGLQLANREEFYVCKKSTNKAQQGYVEVWLTPEGERSRATEAPEPEPPSHLERQLAASIAEVQNRKANGNGTGSRSPAPPSPINRSHQVQPANQSSHTSQAPVEIGWAQVLLRNTNALVDVYAEACQHADQLSVPHAAVRTLLISAFIGQQKSGGPR